MNELFNFKDKRFTWKSIAFLIGLMSVFAILQTRNEKKNLDKAMAQVANEINKKLPMMADSITRLDNAVALPNNILQYNCTILNADKINYDTVILKNAVKAKTLNLIKINPKYKIYKDQNTTLSLYYHDKNGLYLCNVVMTPNDYNK